MSGDTPKARGCLAGHCDIAGKTEGQHHNGGCHCLNGMDPPKRRELRGEMARLRAEAERLTVENAALYGEQDAATKAIVDRHGVRLSELRSEVERLAEENAGLLGERDDARLHELHALARIASPGGHGTAAQAKIMAVERGWGYLFPEGSTTVVEPAEMTVLREWAKTSMITVEEHEENRRVEALDDAKAAALLAGPTGGDQ